MTKIPSNQLTNDFIFRLERQTGYALHDPEKPNLLVIDGLFDPSTVSDEPIALLGAFLPLHYWTSFRPPSESGPDALLRPNSGVRPKPVNV